MTPLLPFYIRNDGFSGYYCVVLRTARLDFHFMLMFANYMTGTPSVVAVMQISTQEDEKRTLSISPKNVELVGTINHHTKPSVSTQEHLKNTLHEIKNARASPQNL